MILCFFVMCLVQVNKKDCFHCGHGAAAYCEKCFQELITVNVNLHSEKMRLERKLALKENGNHVPRLD